MTQKELADTSGVKQQMISKLETEQASETASIVDLATALGVRPSWLANGEGVMLDDGLSQPTSTKEDQPQYSTLSKQEKELISSFRNLPNTQRSALLLLLDGITWAQQKKPFAEPPVKRRQPSKKSKAPAAPRKQMQG